MMRIVQLIFLSPGKSFLRMAGYDFTLYKGEGEAEDRILRTITLVFIIYDLVYRRLHLVVTDISMDRVVT